MTATALSSASSPPMPIPTAITGFYWEAVNVGELKLLRCQACRHFVHYPRPICDRCQSTDLSPESISGRARLYSHTWAKQAFHPYYVDRLPYCIAVVEIVEEDGVRLTTNIVDCEPEEIRPGMELEVVFTEVAPGYQLPFFRPAGAAEDSARAGSAA